MKKIIKCAFVVAFAIATACAGFESVNASNDGIDLCGGPVFGTIESKLICPKCGEVGYMKKGKFVLDGKTVTGYMCFKCFSWFEKL